MELNELFFEIHRDLPREGPGRDRYTKRAYRMLPPMTAPHVLDIGCGPGGPTMALAKLCAGEVIGSEIAETELNLIPSHQEVPGSSDAAAHLFRDCFDFTQVALHFAPAVPECIVRIGVEGALECTHAVLKVHHK